MNMIPLSQYTSSVVSTTAPTAPEIVLFGLVSGASFGPPRILPMR